MNRLHGGAFVRGALTLRFTRAGWSNGNGNGLRLYHTAVKPDRSRTATSVCLRLALAGTGIVVLGLFGKHRRSECEKKAASETSVIKNDTPTKTNITLPAAIKQARDLVHRLKDEVGAPGMVVAVSVDGKSVWSEGFGYADVENRVKCQPETVMRIASISKVKTMTILARLMEQGKLDIDRAVESYVPTWPQKTFNGKPVTITTRQLLSHLSGVRHYDKSCNKRNTQDDTRTKNQTGGEAKDGKKKEKEENKKNKKNNSKEKDEFKNKEYLIKDHFDSVTSSLDLFKDDALCSEPGSKFLYTTHGWTLVSAVVEAAAGQPFTKLVKELFKDLGLKSSYLDENNPIIYNRARYYIRGARSRLLNVPYVDVSYKWAGGGILSTVLDLTSFGNVMLYSFQYRDTMRDLPPGYLKASTVETMWTPVKNSVCTWDRDGAMGLGWGVVPESLSHGCCKHRRFYASHTGGAVGASSALVVLPRCEADTDVPPRGVVVAILTNLQGVGMNAVALKIAELFEDVQL